MSQGASPPALSSLAAGAPEFVPVAPPGLPEGSLAKSSSVPNMQKTASSSSLSAAALNAPVFVPGAGGRPTGGTRGLIRALAPLERPL